MKETTFDEKSGLKVFSLGIVIEGVNPKGPPDEIIVSPIESMNIQIPGLMVTPKKELRAGHPDEKGKVTKNKLDIQDYVKAKWLPYGVSNRVTPPTVYPNETVILFKYSNNDVYYWTTMMHEPDLRKKESGTFAFSNLPRAKGWDSKGKPISYDKSTSYWFEVDSFKKLVSLTTPKNDGEKAVYTFAINGEAGTVTISDDEGSSIVLTTKVGISIMTGYSIGIGGNSVGITGKEGTRITGAAGTVVNLGRGKSGGLVTVEGEFETEKDAHINGDLYTNKLYCDVLIQGNGPTRNKFKKPLPVPLGPDGKPDKDAYYKQHGFKPDRVADYLLGITREPGYYNEAGEPVGFTGFGNSEGGTGESSGFAGVQTGQQSGSNGSSGTSYPNDALTQYILTGSVSGQNSNSSSSSSSSAFVAGPG